jgi:molybdopterin converting factor subunit 1
MQINIRLFATLRQLAGWPQQVLELPEGATVADALAELDRRYPELTIARRSIYVAVNQEYARGTQVLNEGDEMALFPPVSGGAAGHSAGMTCPDKFYLAIQET